MRLRHCWLLIVVGAGAALAAPACSTDSEPVEGSTVRAQIQQVAADEAAKGHTTVAAALEDGVVTDAEFRRAVVSAHQCMVRAGLAVEAIEKIPTLGAYDLSFSWEPGGLEVDLAHVAVDECEDEHSHGVRVAWAHQSGERLSVEGRRLLVGCFAAQGVPVDREQTIAELRVAASSAGRPDAFEICLSQAAADIARGS